MSTLTISTTTQHQGIKWKLAHKKNADADADADDDGSDDDDDDDDDDDNDDDDDDDDDDDADDEDSDDDDDGLLPSASSSSVPQFVKSDPRFDFSLF